MVRGPKAIRDGMKAVPFSFARARRAAPEIVLRHDGREHALVVRPGLAIAAGGAVAIITLAGLIGAGALLFGDTLVAGLLRHQAAVELAYEDRIAALRLQIDRIATKQVLETDGVAAKVDALAKQHSALTETGARLADLVRKAQGTGLADMPAAVATPPEKPDRQAALPAAKVPDTAPPALRLGALERDAAAMNRQQLALALRLADGAAASVDLIETTIGRLGLAASAALPAAAAMPPVTAALVAVPAAGPGKGGAAKGGVGGPFIAADTAPEAVLGRAAGLIERLGTLRRRLATLPLRHPLAGELTMTSPFGGRPDPFLGVAALHTGVDFRAEQGTPVKATAPGTIEATGRQGGYGLAVDIDHGQGISTRYGHLSRIAVLVGQRVNTGDTIGYAGSTGRSTGPHLHYETRVNGEAVDPTDWLMAGERLDAFLD